MVIAGDHRVTDLGTKFLVRRDPGRLEVALVEGRVRFDAADAQAQSQSALLTPGDVVTATASTVFVHERAPHRACARTAWRRGVLVFDKTTLADAAREFNRYNRAETHHRRSGGRAAHDRRHISAPAMSEAFARVVRNVLGLHVENHGDEIVISR